MKHLRISLFACAMLGAMVCWSYEVDNNFDNMKASFLESNQSGFNELVMMFLSDRIEHPDLSHISGGSRIRSNISLDSFRLERYRGLMEKCGVVLITRGDFSGSGSKCTVYMVTRQEALGDNLVQEGYLFWTYHNVLDDELPTGLTLSSITRDWFYFERCEGLELY